ncbi:MAG: hypothetical protein N3G76_01280 [Candidatus Micrarchaeota archaeon]|nr:hypothetical protein [Candidatus Micrarchaeota archaeon]
MVEGRKYKFLIRKETKYIQRFTPTKKKTLGAGDAIGIVLAALKSKTQKQDVKSTETLQKNKPVLKGAMRQVFLYIGIFILILGLIIGYILFTIQSVGLEAETPSSTITPYITLDVSDYGIANIKEHSVMTPYAIVKVEGKGVKEIELFMDAADGPLPSQVYVLNSRREQATYYNEFKQSLSDELSKYGLTVNEIYLDELESLPNGTTPLIIIPTGYIPASLALTSGEGKSLKELAQKGATILYIGYGFNQGVMDERRGRLFPGTDYSAAQVASGLGFDISSTAPQLSGLDYLDTARYSAVSRDPQKVQVRLIYGGISVVSWGGPGYVIIVPNTLDSGWKNGYDAGKDISKIVINNVWLKEYNKFIGTSPADFITPSEHGMAYDTLFTQGKEAVFNRAYARVYARAYDENNNIIDAQAKYLRIDRVQKGTIASNLYAIPQKLSGSKLDVEAFFDENPNDFRQPTPVWIRIINSSSAVESEALFGAQYILPIKYTQKSQYDPLLKPGKYVMLLQTPTTPPRTLGASILVVPKINVVPVSIDWKKQMFAFTLEAPELGSAVAQYTKSLENTYVIIDEKHKVKLSYTVSGNTPVIYFKVEEPLEEGKLHTFRFELVDGLSYEGVSNIVRMYYEQWWFWAAIILTVGIVAVGIMLRAREKVMYAIDIPDFEIRKKKKIFIKKEMVLDLFDSINKDYGWNHMPLMLKELKSGFRKISYQGRPILIGDYNMQLILDKLKYEGLVKEYLDLYTVSKWEQISGFDYKYLSVFRRIRDILINNAIPFTHLNERKDCDVYIKSKRGNFKVVVGEGSKIVERITQAISGKEKVIVVFASEEQKDSFIESISNHGGRGAAIKIAMLNGKLMTMTIKELSEFVK